MTIQRKLNRVILNDAEHEEADWLRDRSHETSPMVFLVSDDVLADFVRYFGIEGESRHEHAG